MFVPVMSNDIYSGVYGVVQENPVGAIFIFVVSICALFFLLWGCTRK